MKILLSLLVIGVLFGPSHQLMDANDFSEMIEPKCYKSRNSKELLNGQESPLPSSLETFVSLVERIEANYTSWNKEKIIENLLLRFRYDDAEYVPPSGNANSQGTFGTRGGTDVSNAHDILKRIFQVSSTVELKENQFTDDEKCALYYMLSHTINDTFIEGEDFIEQSSGNKISANPREQGVVSLNSRTRHAFSLNKVLLGILAGLRGSTEIDAARILGQLQPTKKPPTYLNGKQINNIFGATLGDVISLTNYMKGSRPSVYYFPNGYWEEAVCNIHYKLDRLELSNGGYASFSLLRGAIDGFILGKALNELDDKDKKDLTLSQILRMYYSPTGFTVGIDISWCNRETLLRKYTEELRKEAVEYDALYNAMQGKTNFDPSNVESIVNDLYNQQNKLCIYHEATTEASECQAAPIDKTCETPSDIFAIIDGRTSLSYQYKNLQTEVLGNLSVGFHMGLYDSSMSVFTNLRATGTDLDTIVNASRTSGCPSCAIEHRYGTGSSSDSEINVFRGLYKVLENFDETNSESPGVPARVVMYFNYGNPADEHELRDAISKVRYGFRGTKIFAFGTKKDQLKMFVENGETDSFINSDSTSLLKVLREKVCKVPAQLQFKNCYKLGGDNGEASNKYEGFITPKRVQYWAMYPKHFLRSFDITIKFKTVGSGQIKVCFSRYYDDIFKHKDVRYCPELNTADNSYTFFVKNPCKGYKEYNCRPFYFYVEGKTEPTSPCVDAEHRKCETPNQIRFEVEHKGIQCNGALGLAFSPMTAILALLTLVFAFHKQ